jgi:ubiquinone/menaquinone biosynthesis C-methylase UbiE/ribosome-associated toxin RatA of RatAB toxin-antitoxin module
MPTVHETVEIKADPDTVFDLIMRIEEFPLYTDALEEVRAIGPDTYHWTAKAHGIRLEWDSVVTDCERPKRLAWRSIKGVVNSGGYTLTPLPGGTRVSFSLEYRFPSRLLEKLLGPLITRLTRNTAVEILGRVKRRLEASGVFGVRWLGLGTPPQQPAPLTRTPLDILKEHFARGERSSRSASACWRNERHRPAGFRNERAARCGRHIAYRIERYSAMLANPKIVEGPCTRGAVMTWLAPLYDLGCAAVGLGRRFRQQTLRHAALETGERVFDVGCGTGVLTRLAADIVGPSGSVIGIDPSPDMVRVARRRAVRTNSRAVFQLGVIEALAFEDGCFDAVLSSLMLHHLPPDLKRRGLREIMRVLRPGGRLLLVDVDRPGTIWWWLLTWPARLDPMISPQLRGEVPGYLAGAGFDPVVHAGRWFNLLSFWLAIKPERSQADMQSRGKNGISFKRESAKNAIERRG